MKIAILTTQYPSDDNHYAHTFVHRRSLYFKEQGYDVTVLVPNKTCQPYEFEGVEVIQDQASKLCQLLEKFDVVYFHLLNLYPQPWKNGALLYNHVIKNKIPSAFYMHGSEVQSISKSRNFDHQNNLKQFLRMLYKDVFFMPQMKRIVKKLHDNGTRFITPSHWMHHEAMQQLGFSFEAEIIPNGINTEKFNVSETVDNKKMLCIRPLNSNKYAVDIAIRTMSFLPSDFTLDIYGKGPKYDEYMNLIASLGLIERVKINSEFINNNDMPNVMAKYSYFMSPTRMDAQGVSMCEAMSCSRVVISSNNTAIPEFIKSGVNGILGDSPEDLALSILSVEKDKCQKMTIAKEARKSMVQIDNEVTLSKELEILNALNAR